MRKSKSKKPALFVCAMFLFMHIVSAPVFAEGNTPPIISYITGSVDEGGTMVVMGENFTSDAKVWLWRPQMDDFNTLKANFGAATDPLPVAPPQGAKQTTILGTPEPHMMAAVQLGGQLAVTEGTLPTVAWVETPTGFSQPYMLNKPQLFFLSQPEVLPGQNLRIFGRNLQTKFEINGPEYDLPVAFKNTKTSKVYWGTAFSWYWVNTGCIKPDRYKLHSSPDRRRAMENTLQLQHGLSRSGIPCPRVYLHNGQSIQKTPFGLYYAVLDWVEGHTSWLLECRSNV